MASTPRASGLFFLALRTLVIGYLTLCVGVSIFHRKLLFFPERSDPGQKAIWERARQSGLIPWRNGQGEFIGWQSATGDSAHRLLVFHGNGGNALQRAFYLSMVRAADPNRNWKVYLLEYPGYGLRPGQPTEESLMASGKAALKELQASHRGPVWLLGESLGSGVASALAGQMAPYVGGVLLVTPFDNLTNVATHHYPFLPVRWFLRDRFESDLHLVSFHGPVAFLVAEFDEVIPARLSNRLFYNFRGDKLLWIVSKAEHNNAIFRLDRAALREILDFLIQPTFPSG